MLIQLLVLITSGFYIAISNAEKCSHSKSFTLSNIKSDGPGYCTPELAIQAQREEILYIPAISANKTGDYLMVVDVDPTSRTYSTVIHRVFMPPQEVHCELHVCGWNTCSSCCHDKTMKRNRLICPCFNSDAIWIIDTTNERRPKHHKLIESQVLHSLNASAPHSSHCLPNGEVVISTLGDGPEGNAKGSFVVLDGKNDFEVTGTWSNDVAPYTCDWWYQPYHDVVVSGMFGAPKKYKQGFNPAELADNYGHAITLWSFKEKKIIQELDLGTATGFVPLEVKFLHDPYASDAYIAATYGSAIHHLSLNDGQWSVKEVIAIPPKTVEGWWVGLTTMPAVTTIVLISMDDKYLYLANWVHGDIRQYDITIRDKPKLVGKVFVGGSIVAGGPVTVHNDPELTSQPEALFLQGKKVQGGPEMLQLSLDGKRLYTTTSLVSRWDKQFYPEMAIKGSNLVQIDVDTENGGLTINENFGVSFGNEPRGPVFAHEIRYPGGDCTSDIFVPQSVGERGSHRCGVH